MKTIFITIFEGVEVKNILRTSILENLLLKDVRIVLFTKSQEKVDHYKKEFNNNKILFEVVERKRMNFIDSVFSKLKFTLLKTKTTDLKRKMVCEYEKKYLSYYVGIFLNSILAHSFVRRIVRRLDFLLVKDDTYKEFFDKYNPDIVFMAHLFDEPEISMLREAKKRKIKTIGYINSWDKVTSRCILRLLPDKVVVFNNIVKDELIYLNEVKEGDIFVSGIPQYDLFFNRKPVDKKDFFNKINIPIENELIVYAPMGRAFSSSDWDMIDLLNGLIESNVFIKKCSLLVRFQPNDFIDEKEIKKRLNLKYDVPGIRFGSERGVDWDMNQEDLYHLHDTLYNMSMLICYASSISIDSAVLDKPIINLGFEIKKNQYLLKSPTQYYNSIHYKKALDTKGIDLVKNKEDLIEKINLYLRNSSYKSLERKRLVSEQCVFTDGKSGQRIADFILKQI